MIRIIIIIFIEIDAIVVIHFKHPFLSLDSSLIKLSKTLFDLNQKISKQKRSKNKKTADALSTVGCLNQSICVITVFQTKLE
jgi:hypothetical protein